MPYSASDSYSSNLFAYETLYDCLVYYLLPMDRVRSSTAQMNWGDRQAFTTFCVYAETKALVLVNETSGQC